VASLDSPVKPRSPARWTQGICNLSRARGEALLPAGSQPLLLSSDACFHDQDWCCSVGRWHCGCKQQPLMEEGGIKNTAFLLDVDENGLEDPILLLQPCFPLPTFSHRKSMLPPFSSDRCTNALGRLCTDLGVVKGSCSSSPTTQYQALHRGFCGCRGQMAARAVCRWYPCLCSLRLQWEVAGVLLRP